ncbi:helix-turn-helix domain-containing protein [Halosegnis sp.]|uniref:helix-turn-helix domain-containing protein n=1 Tax=Halosegnis sp. TaxID=2864959 RepID=UPI0035D40201
MTLLAEFAVPAEWFTLARSLQETPGLAVDAAIALPTDGTAALYLWIVGEDADRFDAALERAGGSVPTLVEELPDRRLYRVVPDGPAGVVVRAAAGHDAVVESVVPGDEAWTFRLRFADAARLSAFHDDCRERGAEVTVERLYTPAEPSTAALEDLTDAQRALIKRVYEAGYFDVPRKITLAEIAEELGISDQAVNERLRRGLRTIIGATVGADGDDTQ